MRPRSIVLRADANPGRGAGHVMRMLALGEEARALGWTVDLVSHALAPGLAERAFALGISLIAIGEPGSERDARTTAERALAGSALVGLDHYELGAEYAAALRSRGVRVVRWDDLLDPSVAEADLVVNQNLGATAEAYRGLTPAPVLAGAEYATVRAEFRARRAAFRAKPERVAVSFGGADAGGGSELALAALADSPLAVSLLVGALNQRRERLERLARERAGVEMLVDSPRVAEVLAGADLAVIAPGTTLLEACALGLPTVSVVCAENQRPGAERAAAIGVTLLAGEVAYISPATLGERVMELTRDAALRERMRERAMAHVDGRGAARVLERVAALAGREA